MSKITYSQSIYATGTWEVLSCGLIVGNVRQTENEQFEANPHNAKQAVFGDFKNAIEYIGKSVSTASTVATTVSSNQISMF